MDKDNNNDTSYFNSPDNNNSAGDNHIVYKNKFQPNSRYFTIVIYGLLFVLGAILYSSLLAGLITHLILSNTFLMLYHHL